MTDQQYTNMVQGFPIPPSEVRGLVGQHIGPLVASLAPRVVDLGTTGLRFQFYLALKVADSTSRPRRQFREAFVTDQKRWRNGTVGVDLNGPSRVEPFAATVAAVDL